MQIITSQLLHYYHFTWRAHRGFWHTSASLIGTCYACCAHDENWAAEYLQNVVTALESMCAPMANLCTSPHCLFLTCI